MVLTLIFSLAGCIKPSDLTADKTLTTQPVQQYTPVEEIKMNLPYINSDSLDPFRAKTEINRNLTPLLFDSLYGVGNDFNAIPLVAKSSKIQNTSLVVTIRSGLTFSDGSFVTASDVAYSFEKAKASDRYMNDLSCFDSASALNNYDVSFTFNTRKAELNNLLTFPIIKNVASENTDTDIQYTEETSENVYDIPIGCGRYTLAHDKNNNYYLTCNTERLGGYYPAHRKIGLVSAVDTEQFSSMFSLGTISVIADTYSTGEYSQVIGSSSKLTMSNFIYLVCNINNPIFQDANVKKAISYAIDRDEICDYCFISNAVPTELPFHPDYYKTKNIKPQKKTVIDAKSILDSSGYTPINQQYNFRYNAEDTSKVLEFKLAVCKNNAFKVNAAKKIKEQLDKASIRVEIYQYDETDFFNVLATGGYDMYIGECKLKNSLDIIGFFTSGNNLSCGISSSCDSAAAYSSYSNGEAGIDSFISTFNEDLPFIPLLYRTGNIYSGESMAVVNNSIVSDYYYNTEKWKTTND